VIRDDHNVIPVSMAVLLHVLLLGSMVIAFDFARTAPITPLAIRATLVTEIPEVAPPRVIEPEPEPEPEPEVEASTEPEPEPEPESEPDDESK
jgi:outer membrane biosynthesis protein TonB